MQFHYVIGYDSDNQRWWVEADSEAYFPDGNVWDDARERDANGDWGYGWFAPYDDTEPEAYAIDQKCFNILRHIVTPTMPRVEA